MKSPTDTIYKGAIFTFTWPVEELTAELSPTLKPTMLTPPDGQYMTDLYSRGNADITPAVINKEGSAVLVCPVKSGLRARRGALISDSLNLPGRAKMYFPMADLLIGIGTAGATTSSYEPGDVLLPETVDYTDEALRAVRPKQKEGRAEQRLREGLQRRLVAAGLRTYIVPKTISDLSLAEIRKKRVLGEQGYRAVDMEAALFLGLANEAGKRAAFILTIVGPASDRPPQYDHEKRAKAEASVKKTFKVALEYLLERETGTKPF